MSANFLELKERLGLSGVHQQLLDLEVILCVFARDLEERIKPGSKILPEDVFFAVKKGLRRSEGRLLRRVHPGRRRHGSRFATLRHQADLLRRERTEEGVWYACASESVVLDVIGCEDADIGAGEAIYIGSDRKILSRKLTNKPHRPCIFELVYFARHDSMLDDISVYKTPPLRRGPGGSVAGVARRCPT
ncbi:MAG: hypothetical protein IPK67_19215 [Planctomycetes bacterium]|nr:hypothetical protein [Planctomycetota bacterium]